jgi:hypothetical protein
VIPTARRAKRNVKDGATPWGLSYFDQVQFYSGTVQFLAGVRPAVMLTPAGRRAAKSVSEKARLVFTPALRDARLPEHAKAWTPNRSDLGRIDGKTIFQTRSKPNVGEAAGSEQAKESQTLPDFTQLGSAAQQDFTFPAGSLNAAGLRQGGEILSLHRPCRQRECGRHHVHILLAHAAAVEKVARRGDEALTLLPTSDL